MKWSPTITTNPNPYPVDSTFHACCNGIGKHAPHCVAPPAGAMPDDWQAFDPRMPHRVLLGEVRGIDGVDTDHVCVQTSAIQFSDGRIDDGSVHEPPHVYLRDDALTTTQARELAATLIEAADEVDGWTRLNG